MKSDASQILYSCQKYDIIHDGNFCVTAEYRCDSPETAEIYTEDYYVKNYIMKRSQWSPIYQEVIQSCGVSLSKKGELLKWLDIGSGSGLFLKELEKYPSVTGYGIEPSPAACRLAPSITSFPVIQGDPLTLPETLFPQNVDIISLIDVLAHVKDPQKLLQKCFRALKDGGRLVIKTPHRPLEYYRFFIRHFGNNPDFLEIQFHLPFQKYAWNEDGLLSLLTRAGFEQSDIKPFHEFGDNSKLWSLIDIFHPRRVIYKILLEKGRKIQRFTSMLSISIKKGK